MLKERTVGLSDGGRWTVDCRTVGQSDGGRSAENFETLKADMLKFRNQPTYENEKGEVNRE